MYKNIHKPLPVDISHDDLYISTLHVMGFMENSPGPGIWQDCETIEGTCFETSECARWRACGETRKFTHWRVCGPTIRRAGRQVNAHTGEHAAEFSWHMLGDKKIHTLASMWPDDTTCRERSKCAHWRACGKAHIGRQVKRTLASMRPGDP